MLDHGHPLCLFLSHDKAHSEGSLCAVFAPSQRPAFLSFKVTTPPIPAFGTQYPVMNGEGSNDLNRLVP